MGIYIHHPKTGDSVKIGTMDRMHFSRSQLLDFQERGYRGYYLGEYTDDLEKVLSNPQTIYDFEEGCADVRDIIFHLPVPREIREDPFKTSLITEFSSMPSRHDFKHAEKIKINHKIEYSYLVECQQKDQPIIKATAIGIQYFNGYPYTLFQCHCCEEAVFGIDHVTAMFLRNLYPQYRLAFYSYEEKDRAADNDHEDASLLESLAILATVYIETLFVKLLGPKYSEVYELCESVFIKHGYPTIHSFYCDNCSDGIRKVENTSCKFCGWELSNEEGRKNDGLCDVCLENLYG